MVVPQLKDYNIIDRFCNIYVFNKGPIRFCHFGRHRWGRWKMIVGTVLGAAVCTHVLYTRLCSFLLAPSHRLCSCPTNQKPGNIARTTDRNWRLNQSDGQKNETLMTTPLCDLIGTCQTFDMIIIITIIITSSD